MKKVKGAIITVSLMLLSVVMISGCKSEDEEDNNDNTTPPSSTEKGIILTSKGSLNFSINHSFGNSPLELSPKKYVTLANDTIKVTQLWYYITNVELTTNTGNKVNLGNANLIKFIPPGASSFTIDNVPAGTYTSISYLIGVDSTRNSTGTNQGDLDPNYGMYWTWNTGYVFIRLKGRFSSNETAYSFDIGGTSNLMSATHSLLAYQKSGTNAKLEINMDVGKMFNSPNVYNLKVDDTEIHSPTVAAIQKLRPNVSNSFSLKSVN